MNAVAEWVRSHRGIRDYNGTNCWSDNGTPWGCTCPSETEIGLCADHYEELIPNGHR